MICTGPTSRFVYTPIDHSAIVAIEGDEDSEQGVLQVRTASSLGRPYQTDALICHEYSSALQLNWGIIASKRTVVYNNLHGTYALDLMSGASFVCG